MPRAAPAITRMNAGLLARHIGARIDQALRGYYDAGAQVFKNWIAMVEGPMTRRPGFRFLKECFLPLAGSYRLVPFYYSADKRFLIELSTDFASNQIARVYENGVAKLDVVQNLSGAPSATNPVNIPVTGHSLTTGDEVLISGTQMIELRGRYFRVTVVDANNVTLDGEDGTGRATGTGGSVGRTDDISVNSFISSAVEFSKHQYAQRGGQVFLSGPVVDPWLITYDPDTDSLSAETNFTATSGWRLFEFDSTSGETVQASATTGTITLTGSTATFFQSGDVGRFIRLTDPTSGIGPVADGGGEGFARITAVPSAFSATATAFVVEDLDPQVVSSATSRWAWDISDVPSAVAFFDDRLWYSGVPGYGGQVWASRIGNYRDFSRLSSDEGGLHFSVIDGDNDDVVWMKGLDEALVVGTASAEHTITPVDFNSAIAAGNVKSRARAFRGSEDHVMPVGVAGRVVHVQRGGRMLRDFRYQVETNDLTSSNLTRLSRDISLEKLKQVVYQQEPIPILWARMGDLSVAGCTLETDELVTAWAQVEIGGDGQIVEIATLPADTALSDEFYAIVRRTIDGSTVHYVEVMDPPWESSYDAEDALYLDCGMTRTSVSPATTFGGFDHLEGEAVEALADGLPVSGLTVTNGSITLATAASKVSVGYNYNSDYLSMPIEAGSADGTSQGKLGAISRITLRLYQAGEGLEYGVGFAADELHTVPIRDTSLPATQATPLFDGDIEDDELLMPACQGRQRVVAIRHSLPLPCTVVGIFPRLEAR